MGPSVVLRIIALICFILAAIGVPPFGVALLPAGLAFWVASTLTS